jgi:hypothetical protein
VGAVINYHCRHHCHCSVRPKIASFLYWRECWQLIPPYFLQETNQRNDVNWTALI